MLSAVLLGQAFSSSAMRCASGVRAHADDKNDKRQVVLTGRVVANVYGLSDYFLVGEPGFNAKAFVFLPESSAHDSSTPVKISYQFSKRDPRLPDSFFAYSKRYELHVVRDAECDESVEHLSYMQNSEAGTGKPLPPTYVLHALQGAPAGLLKPESILPCYILIPSKYKQIVDTPKQQR